MTRSQQKQAIAKLSAVVKPPISKPLPSSLGLTVGGLALLKIVDPKKSDPQSELVRIENISKNGITCRVRKQRTAQLMDVSARNLQPLEEAAEESEESKLSVEIEDELEPQKMLIYKYAKRVFIGRITSVNRESIRVAHYCATAATASRKPEARVYCEETPLTEWLVRRDVPHYQGDLRADGRMSDAMVRRFYELHNAGRK